MYKDQKKPAFPMTRAGVAAAAAVLSTVALSLACAAQAAAVSEVAAVSNIAASPIPGASGSISRVTSGAEMLHVTVGHSLFLNTRSRLRRVYLSDPAMLNSVTLSPNQIVVTAMGSGISSLVILDEAGQAQSYVVSSDLDVAGLRSAMSEAMHGDAVNIEGSGDRVTLSGKVGSDALADTAVKLAGLYSKEVANALTVSPGHPKQVRLKVRILEVDRSKAEQLGINLFNPGGNTSFLASTTTSQYASTAVYSPNGTASGMLTTSDPLNFLLYSSKLNLGTTVKDLESKQVLQILAEPTITTISGKTADFLSGGEFPFPMVQPGSNGTAPVVTISFRQYGVKLEFTPIVNEDGSIRLKVAPEVSSLDYTNAVTIGGFTVPALATRRAETEVELRSDQSFAISGLLDQRTTDIMSKTPGAANIPILGALFKSKNVNHATTELVVVVTPTLVDPLTDTADPRQPDLPIPTLNTGKFDKSLGKNLNPHPAAPAINPEQPPTSNPAPAATATPASVATPSPAPVATPSHAPVATPAHAPAAATVAETAQKATPAPAPHNTAASPATAATPAHAPIAATVAETAQKATPAPAPHNTAASPATAATPAHAPVAATVAETAQKATPAPAPAATPTHAPVATPAPAPVATPSPAPIAATVAETAQKATPAPAPAATPSPAPVVTPSPASIAATVAETAQKATPAPAPHNTAASPATAATPSPAPIAATVAETAQKATPTPAPVATPSHAPVVTPSPAPVAVTVAESAQKATPALTPSATPVPAPAATPTPAPVAVTVAELAQKAAPTPAPQKTAVPPAPKPAIGTVVSTASTIASAQPPSRETDIGASRPSSPLGVTDAPASGTAAPPTVASSESPVRYVFDNPTATPSTSGKPAAAPEAPSRSMVQIMALSNPDDAESMVAALKRHGYNAAVDHDSQDSLLHLEVGPFTSKTDAEAMRQRLLGDGYNAIVR
jgi:pilus assembly protein CpaC